MNKKKKTEEVKNTSEIKKEKKIETCIIIAQYNTQLADGTFVPKGKEVEVTAEYAERLKKEKVKDFIIK